MTERAHLELPEELTWPEIMAIWGCARDRDTYAHCAGTIEAERETTQLIESGLAKLRRRFHALNLKDVLVTAPDESSID